MKRIRLLGLALIALIAWGAYASATAFAEDPTILPVPTAGEPASFTAESTGTLTFVGTKKGNEVQCPKFTAKGSFTTQDTGRVTLTFKECKGKGGANCQSGTEIGVILGEGEIELADVLPAGT